MNALASEKSVLKGSCVKTVFLKILHWIQSGNAGDLDTLGFIFVNSMRQDKTPHFFVRQGKTPKTMPQKLTGSRDCFRKLRNFFSS